MKLTADGTGLVMKPYEAALLDLFAQAIVRGKDKLRVLYDGPGKWDREIDPGTVAGIVKWILLDELRYKREQEYAQGR